MTLLHHEITFCNFDGTYTMQPRLLAASPHHWLDFSSVCGTNLYCSPEAFAHIRNQLNTLPESGLTFLGSGNYHYATLALLLNIRRPFSLILFDHHTDLQKGSIGHMLSCGSWVRHALKELKHLRKTMIIGPEPPAWQMDAYTERQRVTVLSEHGLTTPQQLLASIPTDTIYISIDKDLLSSHDAKTNWHQGTMPIKKLLTFIRALIRDRRVEGLDVCGEWPIRPYEHFDAQTRVWIQRNEQSNLAITRTFLKAKKQVAMPSIQSRNAI